MGKAQAPDQGFARLRLTCPRGHQIGTALIDTKEDPFIHIENAGKWLRYRREGLPAVLAFSCPKCARQGDYQVASPRVLKVLLDMVDDPTRGTTTLSIGG